MEVAVELMVQKIAVNNKSHISSLHNAHIHVAYFIYLLSLIFKILLNRFDLIARAIFLIDVHTSQNRSA